VSLMLIGRMDQEVARVVETRAKESNT